MWCNIHQWVCQTCCRGAEPISQAEGGNLLCLRRPEASRLSLRAWNTSRASSEVDKNTSLSLTAFFCETQVCVQKKTQNQRSMQAVTCDCADSALWNTSSCFADSPCLLVSDPAAQRTATLPLVQLGGRLKAALHLKDPDYDSRPDPPAELISLSAVWGHTE